MLEICQENFDKEIVKSGKVAMIDFWAPWCVPCKILAPTVEQVAEELKGKVVVAKCNVDDCPDLATDLSVLNIPSLIIFKGGEEVARMVGVNSKEAIEAKLKSFTG
jgi:thioredoxin 1